MNNKKIFIIFLICISAMLTAKPETITLENKFETDTLFIQQASSATLKNNLNEPGKLQLVLRGIYPKTLYITKNINHVAGTVSLQEFLKIWEENIIQFGERGPSAILGFLNFKAFVQSGTETDSLELINPIYDPSSNSISFTAVSQHNKGVKTGRFKNVVIIYDGLSMSSSNLSHYKVINNSEIKYLEKRLQHESH